MAATIKPSAGAKIRDKAPALTAERSSRAGGILVRGTTTCISCGSKAPTRYAGQNVCDECQVDTLSRKRTPLQVDNGWPRAGESRSSRADTDTARRASRALLRRARARAASAWRPRRRRTRSSPRTSLLSDLLPLPRSTRSSCGACTRRTHAREVATVAPLWRAHNHCPPSCADATRKPSTLWSSPVGRRDSMYTG